MVKNSSDIKPRVGIDVKRYLPRSLGSLRGDF